MRSDVTPIVAAHWATFKRPDGGADKVDLAVHVGLPAAAGVVVWLIGADLSRGDAGSLLAAVGVFTGLLFQLLISVLSTIHREHDRLAGGPNREWGHKYLTLLAELDRNIAYAVVVGVVVAAGLAGGLLVNTSGLERIGASITATLLAHLGLVLLMILKRYRAVSTEAARQAERDLDVPPSRFRRPA